MSIACWVPKATNTHSEYVILIAFFTVTVVARTRLNVTLYVHCLSFLFRSHRNKIRFVTYDKKRDGRGVCGKCEGEAMYVQGTGGEV